MISFFKSLRSAYRLSQAYHCLACMKPPIVTVFGGAAVSGNNHLLAEARKLGAALAKCNVSVLTGGGPGIMEAINAGFIEVSANHSRSIGVGVEGVDAGFQSTAKNFFVVDDFCTRKSLLMRYSSSFVVFPGGIGTMEEIFTLLVEFKHHYRARAPLILFSSHHWDFFVTWYARAVETGYIDADLRDAVSVADSVEEIANSVTSFCFARSAN